MIEVIRIFPEVKCPRAQKAITVNEMTCYYVHVGGGGVHKKGERLVSVLDRVLGELAFLGKGLLPAQPAPHHQQCRDQEHHDTQP